MNFEIISIADLRGVDRGLRLQTVVSQAKQRWCCSDSYAANVPFSSSISLFSVVADALRDFAGSYSSIGRLRTCATTPYTAPVKPSSSCSISSTLPSLLVQRPLGSWRAAWVGFPFSSTYRTIFSYPCSTFASPHGVNPIEPNALMKASRDSCKGMFGGQYAKDPATGHHHRSTSPAAQAMQLYSGVEGLVIAKQNGRDGEHGFEVFAHQVSPCSLPHLSQASAIFLSLPRSSGLTGSAPVIAVAPKTSGLVCTQAHEAGGERLRYPSR